MVREHRKRTIFFCFLLFVVIGGALATLRKTVVQPMPASKRCGAETDLEFLFQKCWNSWQVPLFPGSNWLLWRILHCVHLAAFSNIFTPFIFYGYGCCACVCVWEPFVCCVHRGQKRELNPLELQLKLAVSCYPGAGNRTRILWNSSYFS